MLLIAFQKDGKKYGTYFDIDVSGFKVKHIETIEFNEFKDKDEAMEYLRGQINP